MDGLHPPHASPNRQVHHQKRIGKTLLLRLPVGAQGRFAVADRIDLKPQEGEDVASDLPENRLVVHEEDSPGKDVLRPPLFAEDLLLSPPVARGGKVDRKEASLPGSGLQLDDPSVFLHDGVADRQAQTASLGLGGVEGVEDPVVLLPGNPRSVVPDLDLHVLPAAEIGPFQGGDVLTADGDPPPLVHRLPRVQDDVPHHLSYLALVGLHRPEVFGKSVLRLHGGPAQDELHRLLKQMAKGDVLLLRGSALGEGQELERQVPSPQGGTFDLLEFMGQLLR